MPRYRSEPPLDPPEDEDGPGEEDGPWAEGWEDRISAHDEFDFEDRDCNYWRNLR